MTALDTLRACAPPGWPPSLWPVVEAAYASPGRHYHTLVHVAHVAEWHRRVAEGPGWKDARASFLAVLAHDAVYDVVQPDNEARSAELCRRWAAEHVPGLDPGPAERMVLATAGHAGPPPAGDDDLLHFLDCDLAILGAEPAVYDAYAAGVTAEYEAVFPRDLFQAGRARFLTELLGKAHLFHTPYFRARLDEAARANVARERARLPQ
jgi:predicted metal-dependent HD superfamily phosphohydrolase